MRRILMLGAALCLCGSSSACTQKPYNGSPRHALSGTVKFDGQPIEHGSITFVPLAEGKRVSGGVIENSAFSVPEAKGAHAGSHRVEIHWGKLTGKKIRSGDDLVEERVEGLPAKYHKNSELTVEIPSTDNIYNYDLRP